MAVIVIRVLLSVMLMPILIWARTSNNLETNDITEFFHHSAEVKQSLALTLNLAPKVRMSFAEIVSRGTSVTNANSRPGFVLFGMGRHDETEKPSRIRAQIRISEGLNLDRTGALSDVDLND